MSTIKVAVAKALTHPMLGRMIGAVFGDSIPNKGRRIQTHNAAITPSTKAALFWGFYESAELRMLRFLPNNLPVVELGASIGVMGAHAASKLQPGTRYVAVEANLELMRSLLENIDTNAPHVDLQAVYGAIDYRVAHGTPVPFAIGDSNISSRLGVDGDSNVPTVHLSTLLQEQRIVGPYVLISDIEGAEAMMLQYDGEALERCQVAIIELHSTVAEGKARLDRREVSVGQMVDRFLDLGFRVLAQRGPVYTFART